MSNESIFVKILDREYQVACPKGEEQSLINSAQDLDERMRTVRNSGTVIGLERIAVMTALNLSHELMQARASSANQFADDEALLRLTEKLDQALESFS